MKIAGIQYSVASGTNVKYYTLHVFEDFSDYENAPANGRCAIGKKVRSIYIGNYKDATSLKLGMEIEIYYDEPIRKKDGTYFSSIKKIEILNNVTK